MRSSLTLAAVLALVCAGAVVNAWQGAFDEKIKAENGGIPKVNFFDEKVWDAEFYIENNPEVQALGIIDSKAARSHWVTEGIRLGLRASPLFDPKVYLEHNPDLLDAYGAGNYPWAIIHYLTQGVSETYRETGGPSRIPIFDNRVFQWKWYLDHNTFLRDQGITTEERARKHWSEEGLDKGLVASPHIDLKAYLAENEDLRIKYGEGNYRAALSYFVSDGYKETWRKNGGTTCEFWGTWCHGADSAAEKFIAQLPAMPTYNSTGTDFRPDFVPPVPQRAGWEMSVNGRDCSDRRDIAHVRPGASRVEVVYHLHFKGMSGIVRPCNTFIRHYIDIQTRVQDTAPAALSLKQWNFDDTAPVLSVHAPLTVHGAVYRGYTWQKAASNYATDKGTFPGLMVLKEVNYTISSYRMEDPTVEMADPPNTTVYHMDPFNQWTIVHHYSDDPALGSVKPYQIIEEQELGSTPAGAAAGVGSSLLGSSKDADVEIDDYETQVEKQRALLSSKGLSVYQPPHIPYKNVPIPENYKVGEGVVPYYETIQKQKDAEALKAAQTPAV